MKSYSVWLVSVLLIGPAALRAQTQIDLRTQSKSVDFSSASSTKPSQTGTTLPSTCSVGATFFNTAAAAGHNLFGCTATNTWTLLGANLWFGGGSVNTGDCAAFNSSGNIVSAGSACVGSTAVTMATPFTVAGSLMVSAGAGRQGAPSLCSNSGGTLACPGGFAGYVTWTAASGTNTRQILGPAGPFTSSFNYRWSDTIPTAATLLKIGTPGSGESSLGPAIPDTDYVTPSGSGTLQNKTFDGSNLFGGYLPWTQIATPSAPSAGSLRVYAKTGAGLCWLNSAGFESCGGGGMADPGGSGVLVETSPGVTTNRTITAGSANISITDGGGIAGNPTVDIGLTVNFSGKTTSPVQVGAMSGIPGTCTAGQLYFASDGVAGRQLQTCSATNTWTAAAYAQGAVNPVACPVGQIFFNTSAAAGENLFLCAATNTWSQLGGSISSVFGRTGVVTAQTGDYTYSQISSTPSALPPSGLAFGDLSGSYPNPVVSQVNGAAIPTTGVLKANVSHQIVAATAGTDYMAPTTAVQASQMPALTGDCTSSAGGVATTCTKTSGSAFAASATTDTTNAGNISSGTLGGARLPATAMQTNQSNTISAGTQDFHAAAHTLPAVTGTTAGKPSTCTVGEIYFATDATAGLNQYFCTATNVWTQQQAGIGGISSVFGRTGAISAQSGDYTYAQISSAPTALPPIGGASGDLGGSYPSPTVEKVNGAVIPTGGVLKANSSRQIVAAVAGNDYAPPTVTTAVLKGSGTGGFTSAGATDIVNLFSSCSGTQYLGADGGCHAPSGGGSVVLATGSGAPSIGCTGPSTSNLALYLDTTNADEWWCYATNSWKKALTVSASGPYQLTGATGSAPSTPASGLVTCYFDSAFAQVCVDASGNAWQMVKETTLAGLQMRSCDMAFGGVNAASALANADLGPARTCFVPAAATVVEVDVRADNGTPNIIVGVDHGGTVANLVSAALATAASGGRACSKATAAAGIDGTTCSATLQNTSIAAGDYLQAASGTAGGTAKWLTVHVVYQIN